MTDPELAAVVRGIVPLVREAVTKALADASTKIAVLEAQLKAVGDMRDKVVTLEAKAAAPVPVEAAPVDLAPLLERVAAAEARLDVLGDLRDKVVTLEVKAAAPMPQPEPVVVDFGPLLARMAVAEDRLSTIGDLRDRVLVVESKAPPDLSGLDKRMESVERRILDESPTKDLARLSERLAVVETRAPVAGPAGLAGTDGQPGRDGLNGKDGADGLGFEDLSVDFDGDRTIVLTFERGAQKKTWPIQLPYLKYQALYEDGRTYVKGDVVTWGGSMWFCEAADSKNKKPGESKDWLQCVQRGREGKAGRDGKDLLPVPVLKAGGGT